MELKRKGQYLTWASLLSRVLFPFSSCCTLLLYSALNASTSLDFLSRIWKRYYNKGYTYIIHVGRYYKLYPNIKKV